MSSKHVSTSLHYKIFPTTGKNENIVFFIHGFADCGDEFVHLVPRLVGISTVVLISLPGFGDAPPIEDVSAKGLLPYLEETFKSFSGKKFLVGYSMGGRYALYVSTNSKKSTFESVILISSSAGLSDENEREKRRKQDLKLINFIKSATIEIFVDHWLSLPIFSGLKKLTDNDYQIIRNRKREQSKEVLIQYLEQAGQGVFPDMNRSIERIKNMLHIIVGSNDTKYLEIGKLLYQKHTNSTFHIIDDCGHAIHRENPTKILNVLINIIEKA